MTSHDLREVVGSHRKPSRLTSAPRPPFGGGGSHGGCRGGRHKRGAADTAVNAAGRGVVRTTSLLPSSHPASTGATSEPGA